MGLKTRDDPAGDGSLGKALKQAGLKVPGKRAEKPAAPPPAREEKAQEPVKEVAVAVEEAAPAVTVAAEPVMAPPVAAQSKPAAPAHVYHNKGNIMQQENKPTTLAEQLNGRFRAIGRGTSSARAAGMAKSISEIIAGAQDALGQGTWTVQVMDHTNGLSFPLVMISWKLKDNEGAEHLTAFPLLIEPEDLRLSPRIEKFDQMTYEIITTLGDVYMSQEYAQVVETHLRRTLKLAPSTQIQHAGAVRVPHTLEVTDHVISDLVFQAVNACYSVMDRYVQVRNDAPFTIVGRDMRAERLIGRLQVGNKPLINEVGEPIRADLIARVDSNRQGGSLMLGDTNISTLAGYVEPMYRQPSQDPTRPHPPFVPTLIITHVQAGSDQTDVESYCLALVNGVQLISYRAAWAEQFRPKATVKGNSQLTDVGALGLMTPAGKRIETKDDNFRANFDAFMREYFECSGAMVVALDVADVGPNAWMTDIFKACAANHQGAIKAFEEAMDNLTGKAYSRRAQANGLLGQSPVIAQGARIHAGHYVDIDGVLRDIRDVDLLAVCNAYGKNTQQIDVYLDSIAPTKGTDNTRAAERYTLIDDILQGRQVITGNYTRLYFQPKVLATMAQACSDAKLMLQPSNTVYGLGNSQRMSGFDFAGLLGATADTNMFGGGAVQGGVSTRW